ncbi:MAG: O-antigen ligase family protein [Paludibacter sp.]|nr:O-antigen ligase family protein [Paludibacter sp.]
MLEKSTLFRKNFHTISTIILLCFFLIVLIGTLFSFAENNITLGIVTILSPLLIILIIAILLKARVGIVAILFANYFAIGLSRYVDLPTGLMVDGFLFLTLASVFFSQLRTKVDWSQASKDLTYLVLFWMLMTILQLLNPETVSRTAWMYAMRSMALYSAVIVPLIFITYNKPKDLKSFIHIIMWFTVLAILKGIQQKFLGPDQWELRWLNEPGNRTTHILFGVLRVFSFYGDAGSFGGMMAYFGVIFMVLALHLKVDIFSKFLFLLVSFGSFYAMAISGTRSAVAVPFVGFFVYAFLTKNFKVMFITGIILLAAIVTLKYTRIGQSYYEIRRMRTIFQSEEPSLKIRQENRELFRKYLERRPFGGGVGSAGNWGERFTPETFLAQTPTDGWYVQVWVEQGIVGLIFYLSMILYITFKAIFLTLFRITNHNFRFIAIAFLSGAYGIMVSSYTASTLGQMPGTIIFFVTMSFIFLMPQWEKEQLTL